MTPLAISTPSDREIRFTRRFVAPRGLVFEAFTAPALVSRWLLGPQGWTMPVCEIDLRVGGRIRYEWRHADGRAFGLTGAFTDIAAPARLVHTELFDDDWTGGETTVTTLFEERAGVTTVTLTVLYSSKEARDGALRSGMKDGMQAGYARLDAVLAQQGG